MKTLVMLVGSLAVAASAMMAGHGWLQVNPAASAPVRSAKPACRATVGTTARGALSAAASRYPGASTASSAGSVASAALTMRGDTCNHGCPRRGARVVLPAAASARGNASGRLSAGTGTRAVVTPPAQAEAGQSVGIGLSTGTADAQAKSILGGGLQTRLGG
ncbi:MAG: hypothetical protein M0Z27_13850 [Thermaerobacter sp.]|nr:hypothetical protein [Thermaerobacter sp.]